MALKYEKNEYQIPRGRVFFDPFDAAGLRTGESPFGNCPSFSISIESTKTDHYSSETGLRQKDGSVVVEVNRTAQITCDNVSAENLARYLAGSIEEVSQAATAVTDEAHTVLPGRFYQLGQTETNPAGARSVSALSVKDSSDQLLTLGTDYAVDLELARLQILVGGAITDAEAVKVSYTPAAKKWKRIKTGAVTELAGALRVVADNAAGANRDYYGPSVTLTPSGELPVIADGTDWVTMTFDLELLKPANQEALYVDNRPAGTP
ncbi:MAG: hypothetical protein REI09_11155 [Candidatus Dactylopiibacterium sp.]|nr:hypothetical protein [Candidatus Dactylopiibacterium sp.]